MKLKHKIISNYRPPGEFYELDCPYPDKHKTQTCGIPATIDVHITETPQGNLIFASNWAEINDAFGLVLSQN